MPWEVSRAAEDLLLAGGAAAIPGVVVVALGDAVLVPLTCLTRIATADHRQRGSRHWSS